MCKYFSIVTIIFLINLVKINSSKDDQYISQMSEESSGLNEVVDSASKEDFIQAVRKLVIKSKQLKDSADYEETTQQPNSSTIPVLKAQVNLTSFNCEDKSSSEENQCKSTLVNYPFSTSIQRKGTHYASGALIDTQHVLTVAEVFFNVRETIKLFRVRLGSVDCKKGGLVLPIKLLEIHPSYVPGKSAFDVAVLRLATPVILTDYIKPIPLSRVQQGVLSAKFLTTYWPRLIINGNLLPKTAKERLKYNSMRVSTQKLIPWRTCSTMVKARDGLLSESSLCLKPITTHHSLCMPDVGAPVVAEDGLWGITSGWTSKNCTEDPSPTIFTRISKRPLRAWLKTIIEVVGE